LDFNLKKKKKKIKGRLNIWFQTAFTF